MVRSNVLRRGLLSATVAATVAAGFVSLGCAGTAQVPEQVPAAKPAAPQAGDPARVPPSRPVARTPAAAADKPARPSESDLSGPLLFQIMAAEVAVQRGELGSAFATFLSLARQTRDARLAQRATEVALAGRAMAQALEGATLWRELAPQSADATQTLGALLVANNRYAEAAPILREMVTADPQRAEALGRVQRLLARAPDRAAAFTLLDQLAQPYRDDPSQGADVRVVLATGAYTAGMAQRAADEALAALALQPDHERAMLLAAQALARPDGKDSASGRTRALALLSTFVERQPKAQDARLTYARLLVADARYAEARAQFEHVLRADPDNPDVLYALGVLALDAPPPRTDARRFFERYLDLVEDSPQSGRDPEAAYLNLARIAEDEKKYDEALAWLGRVTGADNEFAARTRKAIVLGRMQRVDEARRLLAETQPANDGARVQLALAEGQVLREARRYRESLDLLTTALARFPDDSGLLYDTAMAAEKVDQIDVMETHLRRLIGLKPDDAQAYNALGYSLADRGRRLPEARQLIEHALKLAPNDAYILDSMGWVCFRQGDLQCARTHLERAYQMRPEAELGAHLGEVLWALGQRDEARRIWRAAHKQDADNETLRATLARLKVRL